MNEHDEELKALCERLSEDHWLGEKPEAETGYGFYEADEKGAGCRRWYEGMTTVIRSEKTGRCWAYEWERGLTECQENEWPDFSDPKTFTEVVPVTKVVKTMVTTYVPKQSEVACGTMDST